MMEAGRYAGREGGMKAGWQGGMEGGRESGRVHISLKIQRTDRVKFLIR